MAMIVCFICYVSEIKSTKQNLCNHYLLKKPLQMTFSLLQLIEKYNDHMSSSQTKWNKFA